MDAADKGLGCCMIGNFLPDPVRAALQIPADLEIMLLLAFGVPKEIRRLADAGKGDSLRYWRDEQGVHYVPKLTLDQVLLGEK